MPRRLTGAASFVAFALASLVAVAEPPPKAVVPIAVRMQAIESHYRTVRDLSQGEGKWNERDWKRATAASGSLQAQIGAAAHELPDSTFESKDDPEFVRLLEQAAELAAALDTAALRRDRAGVRSAIGELEKRCAGCHQDYR